MRCKETKEEYELDPVNQEVMMWRHAFVDQKLEKSKLKHISKASKERLRAYFVMVPATLDLDADSLWDNCLCALITNLEDKQK